MFSLTGYFEQKYVRRCFQDIKYRMHINGPRLKEIITELGLEHIFPANDPLFENISYYPIKPGDFILYICWDCGHANSLGRLDWSAGLCGGCSKFIFNPRKNTGNQKIIKTFNK